MEFSMEKSTRSGQVGAITQAFDVYKENFPSKREENI